MTTIAGWLAAGLRRAAANPPNLLTHHSLGPIPSLSAAAGPHTAGGPVVAGRRCPRHRLNRQRRRRCPEGQLWHRAACSGASWLRPHAAARQAAPARQRRQGKPWQQRLGRSGRRVPLSAAPPFRRRLLLRHPCLRAAPHPTRLHQHRWVLQKQFEGRLDSRRGMGSVCLLSRSSTH